MSPAWAGDFGRPVGRHWPGLKIGKMVIKKLQFYTQSVILYIRNLVLLNTIEK